MRVVNNQKASAKTYILNDLRSNLTNLGHEKSVLQNTASLIQTLTQSSYLRVDQELNGYCTRASEELERAMSLLKEAMAAARELDTTEEIPD
ncbi:MAG: hypothetical protein U0N00_02220 [Oscillospiraceae bacterium]